MELALKTTATAALRSEQALVAAARGGDDRAFEQLYERYRERVTAFIDSKVRDHGRAEDISQEVFMAALRQLRSTDQRIAFKPWIYAIARNACIDEFRRSARAREVPVETDDDFPTDGRAPLSLVPTPPAAIESKQRLEDLRGAFGGLSESHHQLLVMRELEGRSYNEIGSRLGMTRQMVESTLFRARRKLSEEYDELASGRRCEQIQTVIDSGAAFTLRALGIKERRRLTQHLSHCQACRQQARLAGVDATLIRPRSIAARIAALFPFGALWRWPWRRGKSAAARGGRGSGHVVASGAAKAVGTAGSSISLGQAAAVVGLAIAGAGGGIAIAQHDNRPQPRSAAAHHRSLSPSAGAATGSQPTSASRSSLTGRVPTVPAAGAARGGGATATRSATAPSAPRSSQHPGTAATHGSSLGAGATTGSSKAGLGTVVTKNPTVSSTRGAVNEVLGKTVNKVGATVNKVSAPIKKATNPLTAPVSKVSAPVNKAVNPVVSAPVKSVTAPVGPTVKNVASGSSTPTGGSPSSTPSLPSTSSAGSGGASGSSSPVGTVKKVLSGL
jgi:RNA polymerase sigma factor (sigma-70 family)